MHMTVTKAKKMVVDIEKAVRSGDDEAAHALEDDLRKVVLEAVVDGTPYPKELARIALSTSCHEFKRHCA